MEKVLNFNLTAFSIFEKDLCCQKSRFAYKMAIAAEIADELEKII